MTPLDVVVDRLRDRGCNPKRSGSGWMARCPAHDDRHPSLSIGLAAGGWALLHCHAGCAVGDILDAIGLEARDLFPSPGDRGPKFIREIIYEIRDVDGQLVAEHVRREYSDGSKRLHWRRHGTPGLEGLKTEDLPLYGVHELPDQENGPHDVLVVEGEKARDALAKRGLHAVSTVTGASGTPSPESLRPLLSCKPVLWADNDGGGREHVDRIAACLYALGGSPRVVSWPEAPGHGDAADFFEGGGTVEGVQQLIREALPCERSVHSVNSVKGDEWAPPLPLRRDLPDLPAFPLEVLPQVLRDYSAALAAQAQVALEVVASFALAATSLAICGRFKVRPWDGWEEHTNVWVAATAESGTRKSTVAEATIEPIFELELELRDEIAPRIAKILSRKRTLKKQLENAEKAAAAKPGNPDLREKAERLAVEHDKIAVGARPRLVTTNATSEAISKLLAENDGRILVASAEGGEMIAIAAGLYTGGRDNFDVLLKGWSGDPLSIDRKGSEPIHVASPTIAQALMFQPAVLYDMATHKTFRGRGLLARYLYVMARSNVGYRRARGTPVPEGVRQAYHDMIGNLLRLPVHRECGQEESEDEEAGPLIPYVLHLSDAAGQVLEQFFDEIEAQQRDDGPLRGLRDWASKAHGQVARLAAILHMARHHDHRAPWELPVAAETVRAAVDLGRYFLEHAQVAYALMWEMPGVARALKIARHLQTKRIEKTTKRDLHRAMQAQFERADELEAPLQILEDRGYIRIQQEDRAGRGRKPSPTIVVNPHWLRQNGHNGQNSSPAPADGSSVNSVNSVMGDGDREPPDPAASDQHARVRF